MGGIMKVGNKTVYSNLGPGPSRKQGQSVAPSPAPQPTSTQVSVQPTLGIAQYQPATVKEPAKIPTQHRIEAIASKIPFVDAIAGKIKERRKMEEEIMDED